MTDNTKVSGEDAFLAASEIISSHVEEIISHMRPPLGSPGRLQTGLFLTIAEQFEAALLLAHSGAASHSAVHVRSMIEALLAFKLLEKDADYVEQMKFNQLKGQKKILEGIINDTDIPEDTKSQIRPAFKDCLDDYQTLYSKGIRTRQIADNFGHAGLAHLAAPYSFLCSFSHNDIAIIAARHEGDTGLIYKARSPSDMAISILSIALMVIGEVVASMEKIAKFPEDLFPRVIPEIMETWRLGINACGGSWDEVMAGFPYVA